MQSRLCRWAFLSIVAPINRVHPSAQLDVTENRARRRNCCDRILGIARILRVQRLYLPEGVFLYVELFDPQIQGRPRHPEFCSRSIWPSNFSVAFCQSRFDEFLLIILDRLCEGT